MSPGPAAARKTRSASGLVQNAFACRTQSTLTESVSSGELARTGKLCRTAGSGQVERVQVKGLIGSCPEASYKPCVLLPASAGAPIGEYEMPTVLWSGSATRKSIETTSFAAVSHDTCSSSRCNTGTPYFA